RAAKDGRRSADRRSASKRRRTSRRRRRRPWTPGLDAARSCARRRSGRKTALRAWLLRSSSPRTLSLAGSCPFVSVNDEREAKRLAAGLGGNPGGASGRAAQEQVRSAAIGGHDPEAGLARARFVGRAHAPSEPELSPVRSPERGRGVERARARQTLLVEEVDRASVGRPSELAAGVDVRL